MPYEVDLAENALVSLEEVRAFLQKQESEDAQDAIIKALINGASSQIISHTGHEFAPKGTGSETRTFLYVGSRHLDLFPYDVRSVTAVKLASDFGPSEQVTLATGDWRLRPVPAKDGVHQKLKLPRISRYAVLPSDDFEVQVTGLWGFAAVPELVKHWAKVTVAIWLRKDVSAFSRTLAMDEDRFEVPDGLPSAVIRGLCDYTRTPSVVPR